MPRLLWHAKPRTGIALRIEVDHEHALADRRQGCAKIHRCRRLTHAALLIGDREHPKDFAAFRHCSPPV